MFGSENDVRMILALVEETPHMHYILSLDMHILISQLFVCGLIFMKYLCQ